MSSYVPNITTVTGLKIVNNGANVFKSVIVNNPDQELNILEQLAALDGDNRDISFSDLQANNAKAGELLKVLEEMDQGMKLYANDNCPWHQNQVTIYDLGIALMLLRGIRDELGKGNKAKGLQELSKVSVVFQENLLGVDFKKIPKFQNWKFDPREPNHHAIQKAYTIPKGIPSYKFTNNLGFNQPTSSDHIKNLQLYNNSPLVLNTVIKDPSRELKLLEKIAGNDNYISLAEIKSNESLLHQLEGYALYSNDQGEDATEHDLNTSLKALQQAKKNHNLKDIYLSLEEEIQPANQRQVINNVRIILKNQMVEADNTF